MLHQFIYYEMQSESFLLHRFLSYQYKVTENYYVKTTDKLFFPINKAQSNLKYPIRKFS